MPPTDKTDKICKICPKAKPRIEIKKVQTPPEEHEEEQEVEVEAEPEERDEVEEPCIDVNGYGDFEVVTTQHVLTEILPAKKKRKPAFFASCAEKMRYDNLIPCDVTNDHQYNASWQRTTLNQMSMLRVTSDPRWKRLPAIVATIGPSCLTTESIQDLLLSGVNAVRVNLAYGDRCNHLMMIRNAKEAEKKLSARLGFRTPIAIMVDLKGPVILTGRICRLFIRDCRNPQIFLEKDKVVKLTTDKYMADKCTTSLIYINYDGLSRYVRPGMRIYLDDGSVKLIAQKVEDRDIYCVVDQSGYLGNNRNVHLPMIPISFPAYTPADVEDILMAIDEEVDVITLPKARHANAIQDLREKLTEKLMVARRMRERPIMLFAKISNFEGLSNIDAIIAEADGIVIQRGDLGMDLPPEKVFIAQKEIIAKCNFAGKPVICSTQLAHSMLDKIQVSRSDVADIAACVQDGADCISLTHETAIGASPNDVVEMVNHIIREADAATYQKHYLKDIISRMPLIVDPKIAVAFAACTVAEKIRAPAIIVLTTSGKSAKFISWFRPRAVVIAITRYDRTARQMNLWRTIVPLYYNLPCTTDWFMDSERKFQHGLAYGKEFGFIRPGDPVVLVSGYGKDTGFTNCVRIVYASTEPDVYLQHSREFYSNVYLNRDYSRPQDTLPYTPCK